MRRNGEVAKGFLKSYDSDEGIVVVQVVFVTLGVHPVDLGHQVEFLPGSKVVAVTRAHSDTLMTTSGILAVDSSGSEDGKQLMLSTCKISEVQLNNGLRILPVTVYQSYKNGVFSCTSFSISLFILLQCNLVACHFIFARLGKVGRFLIMMGTLLA